jgi:hypothetical protein
MNVFIESYLFNKLVFFYNCLIYLYKISIWRVCRQVRFDFNLGFGLIIKKSQ